MHTCKHFSKKKKERNNLQVKLKIDGFRFSKINKNLLRYTSNFWMNLQSAFQIKNKKQNKDDPKFCDLHFISQKDGSRHDIAHFRFQSVMPR